MIRLIRWAFWLAATFALVYFAATVPLGEKTLFGHLHAIFQTQEAKDLAAGTRDKAEEVAGRVRNELSDEQPPPPPDSHRVRINRPNPTAPNRPDPPRVRGPAHAKPSAAE